MNEEQSQEGADADPDYMMVHTEEGVQLLEKEKWPILKMQGSVDTMTTEAGIEMATQDSQGMGEVKNVIDWEESQTTEGDRDEEAWEMISTKQKVTKRKFYPVVAARKSVRVAGLSSRTIPGILTDLPHSP